MSVGARAPDAAALDCSLPWREPVNRRLALLEIAGLAGAWPTYLPLPELALTPADRIEAARAVAPGAGERLVLLQPGASDPRRRWPARCFAQLGDMLARDGARIVVNGSAQEAGLVAEVAGHMHHPATTLAGPLAPAPVPAPAPAPGLDGTASALGLGGLCGLLARAALVVSNDTGPLHLALALGVPCVGIFWLTNLVEGMPLRPSGLHAALATRTRCPVCGQDNLARRCAHDASFVDEVRVAEVAGLARAALAQRRRVQTGSIDRG
ncbi:glycosyltransferase family 9 protein [Massilia forsythiae]|uniref:Glycosyltransferase family 9 protein n=1 Tax=Massilia forsythiae TaxID=2728020 RepID=A0A7Z2VTA3_9BURK|nr:glycosyltransferase family 9 protein [Massilia forsythiae]QJD98611.1 glycosyltransferase family 9 protein [Massilia forsythiae]